MLKDLEKQAKDRLHSQCSQKPSALRNKIGRDENVGTENPPIASRLSISSTCCFLYSMFKCPQQLLLVASCAPPTPKEMDLPRLSLPENGIYFLTHLPLHFLMALFLCPSLQWLVSIHVPVHTSLMRFQVFTLSAATHHGWAPLYWNKSLRCLKRSQPGRVLRKSSRGDLQRGC